MLQFEYSSSRYDREGKMDLTLDRHTGSRALPSLRVPAKTSRLSFLI